MLREIYENTPYNSVIHTLQKQYGFYTGSEVVTRLSTAVRSGNG
jgi:hypothetical protein